ncbi:MAG: hypothetical protein ACTSR8_21635 [Promethearchaeota archaeon]
MLLYLTSIHFGAVSLRANNTIQLFGIWRGKTTQEWDSRTVMLRIGSEIFAQNLAQQLQILNRL